MRNFERVKESRYIDVIEVMVVVKNFFVVILEATVHVGTLLGVALFIAVLVLNVFV